MLVFVDHRHGSCILVRQHLIRKWEVGNVCLKTYPRNLHDLFPCLTLKTTSQRLLDHSAMATTPTPTKRRNERAASPAPKKKAVEVRHGSFC